MLSYPSLGRVAEWSIAAVLKTAAVNIGPEPQTRRNQPIPQECASRSDRSSRVLHLFAKNIAARITAQGGLARG
jgi:hypothetical protein